MSLSFMLLSVAWAEPVDMAVWDACADGDGEACVQMLHYNGAVYGEAGCRLGADPACAALVKVRNRGDDAPAAMLEGCLVGASSACEWLATDGYVDVRDLLQDRCAAGEPRACDPLTLLGLDGGPVRSWVDHRFETGVASDSVIAFDGGWITRSMSAVHAVGPQGRVQTVVLDPLRSFGALEDGAFSLYDRDTELAWRWTMATNDLAPAANCASRVGEWVPDETCTAWQRGDRVVRVSDDARIWQHNDVLVAIKGTEVQVADRDRTVVWQGGGRAYAATDEVIVMHEDKELVARAIATGERLWSTDVVSSVASAETSPDGAWVAVRSRRALLWLVDVKTGEVPFRLGLGCASIAWDAHGDLVCATTHVFTELTIGAGQSPSRGPLPTLSYPPKWPVNHPHLLVGVVQGPVDWTGERVSHERQSGVIDTNGRFELWLPSEDDSEIQLDFSGTTASIELGKGRTDLVVDTARVRVEECERFSGTLRINGRRARTDPSELGPDCALNLLAPVGAGVLVEAVPTGPGAHSRSAPVSVVAEPGGSPVILGASGVTTRNPNPRKVHTGIWDALGRPYAGYEHRLGVADEGGMLHSYRSFEPTRDLVHLAGSAGMSRYYARSIPVTVTVDAATHVMALGGAFDRSIHALEPGGDVVQLELGPVRLVSYDEEGRSGVEEVFVSEGLDQISLAAPADTYLATGRIIARSLFGQPLPRPNASYTLKMSSSEVREGVTDLAGRYAVGVPAVDGHASLDGFGAVVAGPNGMSERRQNGSAPAGELGLRFKESPYGARVGRFACVDGSADVLGWDHTVLELCGRPVAGMSLEEATSWVTEAGCDAVVARPDSTTYVARLPLEFPGRRDLEASPLEPYCGLPPGAEELEPGLYRQILRVGQGAPITTEDRIELGWVRWDGRREVAEARVDNRRTQRLAEHAAHRSKGFGGWPSLAIALEGVPSGSLVRVWTTSRGSQAITDLEAMLLE